MGKRGRG
jgi:hypothetical protein